MQAAQAPLVELICRSDFGPEKHQPEVLLVAPPPTCVGDGPFAEMMAGADEKSKELGRFYRAVAEENGVDFLDTASVIVSDPTDGIHLAPGELSKLGVAVAAHVRRMLG